jgi:anti-anti-sigma factor
MREVQRAMDNPTNLRTSADMNPTILRVAAPRMITVKNRTALLHHLVDRIDEGARDVVVGLEGTVYIDSSGLALLADVQRVLVRELGGRLRVSGPSPELRVLFDATRLSRVLEVVEAVELPDAEAWLAPEDWTAGAAA